ncbi:MAG: dihydropteroate synthase [Desulfuromonadales bacterium]|nr:dihydropteroate synthase [Desulfuromonadales bacterium]
MGVFSARVLQLRSPADAEHELRRIGVDPGGITSMTAKMQTHCVHLSRLQCRQANVLKQEMLALGGDAAVARGSVACSIDSTDVILIGTPKQLKHLCLKLAHQPFGLPALAMELSTVLAFTTSAPTVWKTARRDLQLTRPLIMGILNVTPDSFSDGARYANPQRAVERAREMIAEGADIIDIGGESTRPGAEAVSAEEETARVIPVISELTKIQECVISIDTWKSAVARDAMASGAEIINDISGFTFDAGLADVASATGAGVVLMHTRGTPGDMQHNTCYSDLIGAIMQSLRDSVDTALTAGIERERIAIDPGIGFAKNSHGNLEILRRLREFNALGLPLLVGTSRKSFIGAITGRDIDNRLFGTAATVALAISHGAHILRVHDVRAMRDVADVVHAVVKEHNA